MTSSILVRLFIEIFSEFGFPKSIISDSGTQFTSQEFKEFTKYWQIDHNVSSPRNPKSNGLTERFVQTIKSSIIKTLQVWEEIETALLAYISMPLSAELPSPAELLNSRKFRSRLPMIVVQLEQHRGYRNAMQMDKEKESVHYNKSAKNLPSLKQGQTVYVQLDPQKNYWTPGIIVGCPRVDRRSYVVRTTEGGTYTRNRKFINPKDTNVQAQQQVQEGNPSARPIHNRRKPDRLVLS